MGRAGRGDYIAAEVVFAARHEGALHVDDVLARRLRIYIEADDRGIAAAGVVARLLGIELGWDDDRVNAEKKAWRQRVDAERAANNADGDAAADAERTRGPDSRNLIHWSEVG